MSVASTLTENELIALVPATLLAVFYFLTDVLTFNKLRFEGRCPVLTPWQKRVALFGYPIWIYLLWIEGLSTRRGDVHILLPVGYVNTVIGWGTTILVLNEGVAPSRQQWTSLGTRLIINSLWYFQSLLLYSQTD